MENKEAMEEKKKAAQKLTMRIITALAVVVIGYVAYAMITKNVNMVIFEVLLGCFVLAYLLLSDVMEPWKAGLLTDLTPRRKNAYIKLLVWDVVGGAALLYWVLGMNSERSNNSMLIPVVIYILAMQMKRKVRPEFEVLDEELEQQDEES